MIGTTQLTGHYKIGPLIIIGHVIDTDIVTDVFIGTNRQHMHKVEFKDPHKAAEFLWHLEPVKYDTDLIEPDDIVTMHAPIVINIFNGTK